MVVRKVEERKGWLFGLEQARVLGMVGFWLERERWVERESEDEVGAEGVKRSLDDNGAPIAEAMDCRGRW